MERLKLKPIIWTGKSNLLIFSCSTVFLNETDIFLLLFCLWALLKRNDKNLTFLQWNKEDHFFVIPDLKKHILKLIFSLTSVFSSDEIHIAWDNVDRAKEELFYLSNTTYKDKYFDCKKTDALYQFSGTQLI